MDAFPTRILALATDGSEGAAPATRRAVEPAQSIAPEMHVVHTRGAHTWCTSDACPPSRWASPGRTASDRMLLEEIERRR